jgi:maleate isomerase
MIAGRIQRGGYDYGRAGRIGIGTPQANPTVETEFSILVPPAASLTTVRLTSRAAAPVDRLRDYLLRLPEHLESFDSFRPDLFGFACTASSYLVDPAEELTVLGYCEARFGFPIITAADAIAWTLNRIGARRIALVSPYPAALADAAQAYWTGRGFVLVETGQAGQLAPDADTRGIYDLGSADAAAALGRIDLSAIDAILLSGTGMPSLPLIAAAPIDLPILSSNLCLAAVICDRLGLGDPIDPLSSPGLAWRDRCRAATAPFFRSPT